MLNGYHPLNGDKREEFEEKDWGFLTDSEDHEILMQRDAHFGGNFQIMIDYYEKDGLGVNPDFDLDRILYLQEIEKETGQNLAALLLSASETERVAQARSAYRTLKSIYEIKNEKNPYPRLIADLILSESAEPIKEMEAIVKEGEKIVPFLLELVQSQDFYDALYPGYGFAPYMAAVCLGNIKSEKAIRPLFEVLSRETLFDDDSILAALHEIGPSAKEFLLKILRGAPFTKDNIQAAYALSAFADEIDVSLAAFEELKNPSNWTRTLFCSYLISLSLGLKGTQHWQSFLEFVKNEKLPQILKDELLEIIKKSV